MELKEFGLFFSKLREESGYDSQRQLSQASGVSNGTIARIESGTQKVSPETLKKLAPFLKEVTYEDLLKAIGYIEEDSLRHDSDDEKNKRPSVFAERLRNQIENNEFAIREIAEKCGVTTEYITNLMTNPSSLPGVGTLYKLAEILNVTPDYLGGFTSDPNGHNPYTPRPRDMQEFLINEEVMLYGELLDEDDKEKLNNILAAVFLDAKKKNKRK